MEANDNSGQAYNRPGTPPIVPLIILSFPPPNVANLPQTGI